MASPVNHFVSRLDHVKVNTIKRRATSSIDREEDEGLCLSGKQANLPDAYEASKVFDESPYEDFRSANNPKKLSVGASIIQTPQQSNPFRFLLEEEPLCEGFELVPEPLSTSLGKDTGERKGRRAHNLPPMSRLMTTHMQK